MKKYIEHLYIEVRRSDAPTYFRAVELSRSIDRKEDFETEEELKETCDKLREIAADACEELNDIVNNSTSDNWEEMDEDGNNEDIIRCNTYISRELRGSGVGFYEIEACMIFEEDRNENVHSLDGSHFDIQDIIDLCYDFPY